MVLYCAIFGCLMSSSDKDRRFFSFPKEAVRCKKWIQACDRPELLQKPVQILSRNYCICDLHFQPSDRFTKKLKAYAVPTLNLPRQENENPTKTTQTDLIGEIFVPRIKKELEEGENIDKNTSDASTQTAQYLSANTPRKRKMLCDLRTEQKIRKMLENQLECRKVLQVQKQKASNISPQLQKLIDLQHRLKCNSRGNRYDKEFKVFALNIFFASPLAYRVLAKTLSLPSERTLQRININIGTKLYPNVLNCLKSKLKNLKESEKYCIICADDVTLKPNLHYQINEDEIVGFHEIKRKQTAKFATQAFVITAKGIFSNWIQPLGYCFLSQSKMSKELKMWLDDLISNIIDIGYDVVAFVSDQDPIFLELTSYWNVTVDEPYFFINKKKMYYIFDIPHLVKSIRNNLMKYDFEFLDSEGTKLTAKWEDVKTLYTQDCKRTYRLAANLTESHINPNKSEKMNMKYVSEVFSYNVAAVMNCSIECGWLEQTSSGTVKLIELMNKTLDVLNSSIVKDSNKYNIAFAAEPHQVEVVDQLELFLSNVRVFNGNKKDVTDKIKCLHGLKISLNNIRSLAQDLQSDGSDLLFTSRLNKGTSESLSSLARHQIRNCRTFRSAFKEFFMENLFNQSEHANYADDLDQLLMNTDDDMSEDPFLAESKTSSALVVKTVDYRFDLPEKNAFVYVCGYLLKKCFDMHKCDGLKQYLAQALVKTNNQEQNPTTLQINPPESFVTCVKAMDDQFKQFIVQAILNSGKLGYNILQHLSDISINDCCSCFPNLFLKKLFVRFRIFNVVQYNNQLLKIKSSKQRYLCVNDIV